MWNAFKERFRDTWNSIRVFEVKHMSEADGI